jgi:hypothetical protein
MRNYRKLKEKLHNDVEGVKTGTQNLNKIAVEAKRVSEVAGNVGIIIQDLDRQFEKATKLNKTDITFMFFATALQCIRQYLLTPFLDRVGHDELGKEVKREEKRFFDKNFGDVEDTTKGARYYHATLDEIIQKGVPYDAVKGSNRLNAGGGIGESLGLGGKVDHRYQTLGHDPLLGYVFGTSNIMTSTLTNYKMSTFHVVNSVVKNNANTKTMFDTVYKRSLEQPQLLGASVIKQHFHIKSDLYSKNGLPIPVVPIILSPEAALNLSKFGIDFGNIKTIGKQATFSILIYILVGMIHGLFYDESVHGSRRLYEVKTRKILSYSGVLSSASNIIYVAFTKDFNKLDIGGMIVTLYRLITDYQFIKEIKFEFLEKEFYNTVMGDGFDF